MENFTPPRNLNKLALVAESTHLSGRDKRRWRVAIQVLCRRPRFKNNPLAGGGIWLGCRQNRECRRFLPGDLFRAMVCPESDGWDCTIL